ncbi:Cro/CI family transcriptional regulator [Kushneria sp. AK178]
MTLDEAINYYGGRKIDLAKALGISASAITLWGESIPMLRQFQIESLTRGRLKADRKPLSVA